MRDFQFLAVGSDEDVRAACGGGLSPDRVGADLRLGERVKGAYAYCTLVDLGDHLPNGTDSPTCPEEEIKSI